MKRTLFALVVLGLALALTSLHLVRQLRQEQATVAALERELAESRSAVQARSASSPRTAFTPSDTAAPLDDSTSTASAELPLAMEGAVEAEALIDQQIPGVTFRQNELLHDPDYRAALRQRNLLTLPRTMPGLREALGLSDEQAAQLFELLADQQVDAAAVGPPQLAPGQSPEEVQRLMREQRQQQDEQAQSHIRQLLGEQGFQRWQDYRASLGVRHQVEQMRTMLARRGVVVDEQLVPVLVRALADDQAAWAQQQQTPWGTQQALSATPQQALGGSDGVAGAGVDQRLQMRGQHQDRMFQTIAPYLTGEQRRVLQEEQQAGLALLESQMSLMRLQRHLAGQRTGDD